ncbi:hypothetical protein SAMN02745831_03702 [Streptomyces sp. PgraA7]|nr:hypothetical protein SAMN02745831_03702 [Streptomyces sp. PgraA7]
MVPRARWRAGLTGEKTSSNAGRAGLAPGKAEIARAGRQCPRSELESTPGPGLKDGLWAHAQSWPWSVSIAASVVSAV